jgi:hypothetical protein
MQERENVCDEEVLHMDSEPECAEPGITVVRDVLGHAHLDTTSHYAQASLETKRKAHEKVSARPAKPTRWKRDQDLLAWLDSLYPSNVSPDSWVTAQRNLQPRRNQRDGPDRPLIRCDLQAAPAALGWREGERP